MKKQFTKCYKCNGTGKTPTFKNIFGFFYGGQMCKKCNGTGQLKRK